LQQQQVHTLYIIHMAAAAGCVAEISSPA
jgi:hypothetical protein